MALWILRDTSRKQSGGGIEHGRGQGRVQKALDLISDRKLRMGFGNVTKTLRQEGGKVLVEGLGPVEALRFLNFSRERRIESVKRHREWQKTLDQKQFFDDMFAKE